MHYQNAKIRMQICTKKGEMCTRYAQSKQHLFLKFYNYFININHVNKINNRG